MIYIIAQSFIKNYLIRQTKLIVLYKEYDSSFNIQNYKVIYNKINSEHIFFTEYLDKNMETNKVYLVVIRNGIVDDIILSGITKNNLTRGKSYDISNLNNRTNEFEIDKLEKIKNYLNKTVQLNKFNSNISDIEEKYYSDYNTKQLKHVKNGKLDTKEVEEVQVIL